MGLGDRRCHGQVGAQHPRRHDSEFARLCRQRPAGSDAPDRNARPLWLVLLTAIIVNLRFVVYTALLRPHFTHLSAGRRLWLGYIVGDIMFVRFTSLLQQEPNHPHKVAYYTGGALANWAIWQVSSLIGIFAASAIPASWGLELAGTLALVALLVPLCRQWPALAGAVTAAVVAVLAHSLPLRLGLLCGVIVGIAVALAVDHQSRDRRARRRAASERSLS